MAFRLSFFQDVRPALPGAAGDQADAAPLYSIMFKATTNARTHVWSFHLLGAIAASCAMLRDQAAGAGEQDEILSNATTDGRAWWAGRHG
jgi:hypothetical protein